jgi:hypothetical protein
MRNSGTRSGGAFVLAAVAFGAVAGCSRQAFRERADKDVEGVITQKNLDPAWKVENWHAYPDPRARFADPSCPDFPPYPPDDYYAHLTSPTPQRPGRGGAGRVEGEVYLAEIAAWDAQNRAEDAAEEAALPKLTIDAGPKKAAPDKPAAETSSGAEPVAPNEALGAVAGGAARYQRVFAMQQRPFRLRLNQSVELALYNAREFQDRREDLYLAALPVTLERFSFAAQAFASEQIIRQATGTQYPGTGGNLWSINGTAGFNRTFATGGTLLVRLANQIVVNLSGPQPQFSMSNLGLTFIQPLLRGGGWAVTLENLTQAERTLLYAIRSYARFRKVFYVAIVAQNDYTNNPYGLQGLAANLGRGVGANLTARQVGYLPTVLRGATLANERKNVAALENFLLLFENLKEGGGVNELQVNRVEQNLLRSRSTVLISTRTYLDNLDSFKLQLGVPATMPLELDDAPLRPIRQQLGRFEEVYAQLRDLEDVGSRFDPAELPSALRGTWQRLFTESPLVRGTSFAKNYASQAGELRRELDQNLARQLTALSESRRKLLDVRADRQLKKQPEPPELAGELAAIEAAVDRIAFEQQLRRYETRTWLRLPPERQAAERANQFRDVFQAAALVAIQPRDQRLTRIRSTWPLPPAIVIDGVDLLTAPLDESYTRVAQAALINRFDLMNARAQVVDQWRKIAVQANSLLGTFDVRYDLNAATPLPGRSDLGLAFAGQRTQNTVTVNVSPPFVRRAERNNYRASLIAYQRQRRNLQAFEDNIITDSRVDLRTLRQLAETYRLQQRAAEIAYAQVDNAQSTFVAPPDPAARESAGNVAALTQQLLEAQSNLLQAQNDLYTTWVTYLTTRMELYLDLELLPLDARGLWTDDPSPPPGDAGQVSIPPGSPGPGPGPAAAVPGPAVRGDDRPLPGPARPGQRPQFEPGPPLAARASRGNQ